ncbi:MAG: hypothetical protein AMXMBFR56_81700 [Polyangiaceae bacterium]
MSSRGLGLVALPPAWDLAWPRIVTALLSEPLRRDATEAEQIARRSRLADGVLRFADRVHATSVWIEGYPLSGRVHGLSGLCELGGVVRDRLAREGLDVRTAPLSSARKLVLGRLPRADVKQITHTVLHSVGAPASWSGDELDAFVAGNYGASELGVCCIVCPEVAA